jgi:hypothetical protein
MKHGEFRIGGTFWCGEQRWRCTVSARARSVAIRLDHSDAQRRPSSVQTIEFAEAEAEGWFNGPPYAAVEYVFDEDSIVDYPLAPDSGIP